MRAHAFLGATFALALLLAGCSNRAVPGALPELPSNVTANAKPNPCAQLGAQGLWFFHGACKTIQVAAPGSTFALAGYKGFLLRGVFGTNNAPKSGAPFVIGDATGGADITGGSFLFPALGSSNGCTSPKPTECGLPALYFQVAYRGKGVLHFAQTPLIQVISTAPFQGLSCALYVLSRRAPFPWQQIGFAQSSIRTRTTVTFGTATMRNGLNFSNGPVYFAVGCRTATYGKQVFTYTGAQQQFVVPPFVTSLIVTANGAQGGNSQGPGGQGGSATATFSVLPGDAFTVTVGGMGGKLAGGFGGGGSGGANSYTVCTGAGGGGASTVVLNGSGSTHPRVVAGGGGGGGGSSSSGKPAGGAGGGNAGLAGGGDRYGGGGGGGTATAGGAGGANCCQGESPGSPGAFGIGGAGAPADDEHCFGGGGGGGGYFGGGGGASGPSYFGPAGGGGSGYISPGLTHAKLVTGGQTGNGQVTFIW